MFTPDFSEGEDYFGLSGLSADKWGPYPASGATDAQCCNKLLPLWTAFDGRVGIPVCCDGRRIPCVNFTPSGNTEADALIKECGYVHENSHAADAAAWGGSVCERGSMRPAGLPSGTGDKSECKAYSAEINCLYDAMNRCSSDECRQAVWWQIGGDNGQGASMGHRYQYCARAGMTPPSVPPWSPFSARGTAQGPPVIDNTPGATVDASGATVLPPVELGKKQSSIVIDEAPQSAPVELGSSAGTATPVSVPPESVGQSFSLPDLFNIGQSEIFSGGENTVSAGAQVASSGYSWGAAGKPGGIHGLGAAKKTIRAQKPVASNTAVMKPRQSGGDSLFSAVPYAIPIAVGGLSYAATRNPAISLALAVGAFAAYKLIKGTGSSPDVIQHNGEDFPAY